MTAEDYHASFSHTWINFDLSDGDWHEDHYIFLNDEDRRNGTHEWCIDGGSLCTKHEFTLKNNSTEVQKAYI